MLSEASLRNVLQEVPGAVEVDAHREGSKWIALVVSPEFADVEEHDRQARVWDILLNRLTDEQQAEVGYVFTNTPEEKADVEAQIAQEGQAS